MAFSADQVGFYLSGGPANTDPNASLGGLPSPRILPGGANNLFSKVTASEASVGGSRYRCLYLINLSSETLIDLSFWVEQTAGVLSGITIGVESRDEVQRIDFQGEVTGGTFILKYTVIINQISVSQTTSPITWDADATVTATNIQTALNALTYLEDLVVVSTVTTAGDPPETLTYFTVTFAGASGQRSHMLLEFDDISLTGTFTETIRSITRGAPLNAIASDIGFENQPPFGVNFAETSISSPLVIGDLLAGEVAAVWVRRLTLPLTAASSNDVDQARLRAGYSVAP